MHPHTLKVPGQKTVLVSSIRESREKKSSWLSLDIAMDELSRYRKNRKGEAKKEESLEVDFHGMAIVLGVTRPTVFDGSPYYVDYANMVTIPDAPFVSCLIRERNNPVHVVGDMGIEIRFLKTSDLNAENLKQQAISAVLELDEQVEA